MKFLLLLVHPMDVAFCSRLPLVREQLWVRPLKSWPIFWKIHVTVIFWGSALIHATSLQPDMTLETMKVLVCFLKNSTDWWVLNALYCST